MKVLALLIALTASVYAQYSPPVTICEVDNDPCIPALVKLVVSNGTLTVAGKTAIVSTGGGGGAVTSVFGRNGVVTALAGDYTIGQITIGGTPDGTKFLRDDGTWQPAGGSLTAPFSVTDSLNDTTPNYNSYAFNVIYNGIAGAPSTLVNLGVSSRLTYGNTAPAVGTHHNITTTADIIGSGSGANEFAALMGWMRFSAPGRAWFTDWSLHGRIANQQELLNGVTMLTNNYFNGQPTGGPSAAFIAVSAEGKGAGGEGGWTTAQTYPVGVGFAAVGHSGIGGGATTGRGFNIGFLAGSNASGWMVPTEASWIGVGFQAQDFDTAGVVLGQPRGLSKSGILVAPFDGGGLNNYGHIIDFTSVDAADIATGGSAMYLPAIGNSKLGILFGGSTRLYAGGSSIARFDGRVGVGGDMTTASALLEVVGTAGVSDPLFAVGSPGATDANSFKFYNGNGDLTSFIAGGAGQFVPNTAQGDGGMRVLATKKIVFGDPTGARLILPVSVATPVNYITIGNAATGNRPTLNPAGSDTDVGIVSTQKGSGAFLIESGSGLNDVTVAAIRRTGTTRGFNFIPAVSPSADPHLRLASGQTWSTSFFNEVDGTIASMSINMNQSGTRTNSTVGGIFRLDTRTGVGGLANGEQAFVVYGNPTGGDAPVVRFVSSLQDGNTLVNLNGGTFGVGISTASTQQFSVTSLATTRVTESLNSIANSSVDLVQWNNNVDDTSTVANLATLDSRSNGTAATGFGHSTTHTLESSTTNARTAATQSVLWTDATDATRTSAITFSTVNSATLAERVRVDFFGIQYSPVTFANLGTPGNGHFTFCSDCLKGSNPCSGASTGSMAARLNGVWRCD